MMTFAGALSFPLSNDLTDNFAAERAALGGDAIEAVQSIRQMPGFPAFASPGSCSWRRTSDRRWRASLCRRGDRRYRPLGKSGGPMATTTGDVHRPSRRGALDHHLARRWLPRERAPLVLAPLVAGFGATTIGSKASLRLASAGGDPALAIVAVAEMTAMLLTDRVRNPWPAPRNGRMVSPRGRRRLLTVESARPIGPPSAPRW
jgi:hypothetical protein